MTSWHHLLREGPGTPAPRDRRGSRGSGVRPRRSRCPRRSRATAPELPESSHRPWTNTTGVRSDSLTRRSPPAPSSARVALRLSLMGILSDIAPPMRPRLRLCPADDLRPVPMGSGKCCSHRRVPSSFEGQPALFMRSARRTCAISPLFRKGLPRWPPNGGSILFMLRSSWGRRFRALGHPRRTRREKHVRNTTRARRRVVATIPVLALAAAGLGDHGLDNGIGCAIARLSAGDQRRRVLHGLRRAPR